MFVISRPWWAPAMYLRVTLCYKCSSSLSCKLSSTHDFKRYVLNVSVIWGEGISSLSQVEEWKNQESKWLESTWWVSDRDMEKTLTHSGSSCSGFICTTTVKCMGPNRLWGLCKQHEVIPPSLCMLCLFKITEASWTFCSHLVYLCFCGHISTSKH